MDAETTRVPRGAWSLQGPRQKRGSRASLRMAVIWALPAVSARGPLPQPQSPERELRATAAPAVNAGEEARAEPSLLDHGPAPQVLTGIETNDNEDAQKDVEDAGTRQEPEKSKSERSVRACTPLLSVAGVELGGGAVGPALEFLEFCAAFREPLEMKQAEALMTLREIVLGRKVGNGWGSPVARVHTRLLNVLTEASDEPVSAGLKNKNSWLSVLGQYMTTKARDCGALGKDSSLPSSPSLAARNPAFSAALESLLKYSTALRSGADGYLSLAVDEKLHLLNILCNDALGTALLREHIDKELDDEERMKEEAKKRKEEDKGQNSKASTSALTAEKRTVRTRSSYEGLPESSGSGPPGIPEGRRNAVKTEAIVWLGGSHALWSLKGGDDRSAVFSQHITNIEGIPKEEWTVYPNEGTKP